MDKKTEKRILSALEHAMREAGKEAVNGGFITSRNISDLMMECGLEDEAIFPTVVETVMKDSFDSLPIFRTFLTYGEICFEGEFMLSRPAGKHSDQTLLVTNICARVCLPDEKNY